MRECFNETKWNKNLSCTVFFNILASLLCQVVARNIPKLIIIIFHIHISGVVRGVKADPVSRKKILYFSPHLLINQSSSPVGHARCWHSEKETADIPNHIHSHKIKCCGKCAALVSGNDKYIVRSTFPSLDMNRKAWNWTEK